MASKASKKEKAATKKVVVEEVSGDVSPSPAPPSASADSVAPDDVEDTKTETPAASMPEPTPSADSKPSTDMGDGLDTSSSDSGSGEGVGKDRPKIGLKEVFFIAFPTAIIVAALTGGILYYNNNRTAEGTPAPTSTAAPTTEPEETASPSAELSRGDLSVQVLNGTGESGVATTVKTLLEDLGYEDVDTANAATYDFEETVISIKEDKEDYLDMIIADLEDSYTIADDTETLDEDGDYDVTITVGSS